MEEEEEVEAVAVAVMEAWCLQTRVTVSFDVVFARHHWLPVESVYRHTTLHHAFAFTATLEGVSVGATYSPEVPC